MALMLIKHLFKNDSIKNSNITTMSTSVEVVPASVLITTMNYYHEAN